MHAPRVQASSAHACSNRAFVLTALLGASLAVACSAPPPLRTQDVPSADVTAAPQGPAFDLSPVPAPSGVFAKGRAKNLAASLQVLGGLVGVPGDVVVGAGKGMTAQALARGLRLEIEPSFAEQISLDTPVDFAIAAVDGPDISLAVSIGLTSIDGAKAAAGPKLAEIGPGVWALGGERAKAACAIMASAGASPARLVCGPRESDIANLGPYLARTLSIEPLPSQDLVADIDVAALNAKFGGMARKIVPGVPMIAAKRFGTGNPTYDKGLEEAVRFIANDATLVLEDLKNIHVEGKIDPAQGLDLDVRAELSPTSKSWFAKTSLAGASLKVPDILWKGPADASGAVFGTVVDPAAYGDITKALKGMVSGGLEALKIGNEGERKKVADLLDLPLSKNASFVGLGGFGHLTKRAEPKTAKERQQQHFDRLMGWYMVGSSQKADVLGKWLKDAAAAFNQPGVQKALKKELGKDDAVAISTAAAPKELGKGALQLNVAFSSKSEAGVEEGTLMMLLMPDGDNTWLAVGFDRGELIERLLRAKDGKDSLKGRTDLSALTQGGTNGGAFITMQSFRSSVYAMMFMKGAMDKKAKLDDIALQAMKGTDDVFASLPQKGLAPIFMRTSVQNGTVLAFDLELRKPVLDDASALVKFFTGAR